jgi:hypothetical protein
MFHFAHFCKLSRTVDGGGTGLLAITSAGVIKNDFTFPNRKYWRTSRYILTISSGVCPDRYCIRFLAASITPDFQWLLPCPSPEALVINGSNFLPNATPASTSLLTLALQRIPI